MKPILRALTAALVLAGTPALAQGLPERIAEPYLAYTRAQEAGDLEAAYDAARRAWRAAERLDYDLETTGILADNFAEAARRVGRYEEAAEGFERSAEIQQRLDGDPLLIAETWNLAASAALSADEDQLAYSYGDRAGDLMEASEGLDPQRRAYQHFNGRAFQAHSLFSQGRVDAAAGRAREALAVLEEAGLALPATAAMLAFYRGVEAQMHERQRDAAYWLSAAYALMARSGRHDQVRTGLKHWADYARGRLNPDERMELISRLREDDLIVDPEALASDETSSGAETDASEGDNVTDAYPLERPAPPYPRELANAELDGVAVLQFSVDERGRVVDPEVLFSIPYAEFGEAAIDAVDRWRYEPKRVDGEPVRRDGVVVHFNFVMAN